MTKEIRIEMLGKWPLAIQDELENRYLSDILLYNALAPKDKSVGYR
jgi:hypothetical protein